jgi:hypothetical protein
MVSWGRGWECIVQDRQVMEDREQGPISRTTTEMNDAIRRVNFKLQI